MPKTRDVPKRQTLRSPTRLPRAADAKFKNYLQKDAVRFDREVTCINPDHKWPRMKDTLCEQFSMYSIITELPKSAFGKIKQQVLQRTPT